MCKFVTIVAVAAMGLMTTKAEADAYVWMTADGVGHEGAVTEYQASHGDVIDVVAWVRGVPNGNWTGNIVSFGGDVVAPEWMITQFDPDSNIPLAWDLGRSGVAGDSGSALLIDDVGAATSNPGPSGEAFEMFYFTIQLPMFPEHSEHFHIGMQGSGSPQIFRETYSGYGPYTGYVYMGDDTVPVYGSSGYDFHTLLVIHHPIPEPATLVLLGIGAMAMNRRR